MKNPLIRHTTLWSRNSKEILIFLLLVVLILVALLIHAFVLGQPVLDALYNAIRLIALEDSQPRESFVGKNALLWWPFYQALRVLVPVIVSWLLIEGYLHLIGDRGSWLMARFRPHDVIVAGDSPFADEIARRHSKRGERVARVISEADSVRVPKLRNDGIHVYIASTTNPDTYRWLSCKRVPVLYIIGSDDNGSIDILDGVMQYYQSLRSSERSSGGKVAPGQACMLHVVSDFLAAQMAELDWYERSEHNMRLRVFSIWKDGALQLLVNDKLAPHMQHVDAEGNIINRNQPHVLMLGFSLLGESILEQLARLGHYPNEQRARLTIVSENAAVAEVRMFTRFPALAPKDCCGEQGGFGKLPHPVIDVDFIQAPADGITAATLGGLQPVSIAYVCTNSLAEGVDAIQSLLMACPNLDFPIALCIPDEVDRGAQEAIARLPRCHVFDIFEDTFGLSEGELVIREFSERQAAIVHFSYSTKWPPEDLQARSDAMTLAGKLPRLDDMIKHVHEKDLPTLPRDKISWNELLQTLWFHDQIDEWQRISSRDVVRHLHVKQAYFPALTSRGEDLSEDDRVLLSKLEHQRWCAERLLFGWRYAANRCNKKRLHNLLVPFDDLEPAEQQKDDQVVKISSFLSNHSPD